MTGDAATADDLVQETFVRAMSGRLPVSLDTAEAWMVRILVNLCRDLYRWRKVRHDHAGTVEAVTSDRAAAGNPESQAMARVTVEKALRKLPARRRAVLVMHDLEGLEPRRIGELLGLRPATVRGYLATARREMKELIERSER